MTAPVIARGWLSRIVPCLGRARLLPSRLSSSPPSLGEGSGVGSLSKNLTPRPPSLQRKGETAPGSAGASPSRKSANRGTALTLGFLLLFSTTHAYSQPVIPAAGADRTTVLLSESVRVTLALEGPAPLRVDLPQELLAGESLKVWRVRPAGPATVTPLPGDRERWVQVLRLDPYLPGEHTIAFAPAAVNGQSVAWPPVKVQVNRTITDVRPADARPVTGIENLPGIDTIDNPARTGWLIAGVASAIVVTVAGVVLVRRWRAKPPPLPPGEWALAAFDRLERDVGNGGVLADGVAAVLREYIDRRFALPAPRLTTGELLTTADRAGWPADHTAELAELLGRCDRAKFAGDIPGVDESGDLLRRARTWVEMTGPPVAAGVRADFRGPG